MRKSSLKVRDEKPAGSKKIPRKLHGEDFFHSFSNHKIPQSSSNVKNMKIRFCPNCSNLLTWRDENLNQLRYTCHTCPFILRVTRPLYTYYFFPEFDEEDMIVDQDKSDESRQKTETICPECTHNEAYFYQMQTRSADEPMTNFYECTNKECKHHWRD